MDEEAIAQFISITGSTRNIAIRMLDAAGGDTHEAIEQFYSQAGPSTTAAPPSKPKTSTRNTATVRSLGDIQNNDDSGDDDDFNDYYVGGEKSGQLVRGAPKPDEEDEDAIENLFEDARRAGAVEGRPSDLASGSGSKKPQYFTGKGRTLTGAEADAPVAPPAPGRRPPPSERSVDIFFYRNGIFTVNDEEPRRIDDPANMPFITAISRGQCPPELDPGDPSVHINVNLIRRDEDYVPPKFKAFGGSGQKLGGSGSDGPSSSQGQSTHHTIQSDEKLKGSSWQGADPSKPKTSIQLRLGDGSRLVAEFNLDHTIGDIRRFIHTARPDMRTGYTLATAFPSKILDDDGASIESAGVANSVVMQKMV